MKRLAVLMIAAVLTAASGAGAQTAALVPLQPKGSGVSAAGFRIGLGEADDAAAPRAWQGPLRVTAADGRRCTVDPDVALLERPFALSKGHLLLASTYSGSSAQVYVVDLRTCAVTAKSPTFTGAARLTDGRVRLPGLGLFTIGPDGRLLHH